MEKRQRQSRISSQKSSEYNLVSSDAMATYRRRFLNNEEVDQIGAYQDLFIPGGRNIPLIHDRSTLLLPKQPPISSYL